MPSSFFAAHVSTDQEDDVLYTHFAAPTHEGEDRYLLLQLELRPDEQDRKLGLVGPHIEFCTQSWGWYGNIQLFELFRERVVVRMSPEAASRMQNDGVIGVEFELDEAQFADLKRSLTRIFCDSPFFVVHEQSEPPTNPRRC